MYLNCTIKEWIDPKELPECLNSCGTAGGATFFAVAAGLGGRDIPPTVKRENSIIINYLYGEN